MHRHSILLLRRLCADGGSRDWDTFSSVLLAPLPREGGGGGVFPGPTKNTHTTPPPPKKKPPPPLPPPGGGGGGGGGGRGGGGGVAPLFEAVQVERPQRA